MHIHTVKKGDTLWQLGQRFGVSTDAIATANGISADVPLVIGQAIIIPSEAGNHKVLPGESLWSIGLKYGVTIEQLMRANELKNPALIKAGQVLVIPQPEKSIIEVNGYTEKFGANGVALVHEIGANLTYLSPFSYRVQLDGTLVPIDDSAIIEAAFQEKAAPMMVLTNFENGTFSSDIAHAVLTDAAIQSAVIASVLSVMQQKRYMALNVDFEYVRAADRESYNAFLQKLVDTLHPYHLLVSTCLAPKQSAEQKGTLYEGHDYAAHGRIVDFVILMTYEWGWSGGPPLAVAPLNEVVKVLNYALSVIPASKIVMGMPLYGYDWTLPYVKGGKWAPTVNPPQAIARAAKYGATIQYDPIAESPHYTYYDEQGAQHEVWYEDARSVQAKFNIVKDYKLRGVSYWVLGVPFPQNWYVLQQNFTVRKLV